MALLTSGDSGQDRDESSNGGPIEALVIAIPLSLLLWGGRGLRPARLGPLGGPILAMVVEAYRRHVLTSSRGHDLAFCQSREACGV